MAFNSPHQPCPNFGNFGLTKCDACDPTHPNTVAYEDDYGTVNVVMCSACNYGMTVAGPQIGNPAAQRNDRSRLATDFGFPMTFFGQWSREEVERFFAAAYDDKYRSILQSENGGAGPDEGMAYYEQDMIPKFRPAQSDVVVSPNDLSF